jgi:dynein heavy chain
MRQYFCLEAVTTDSFLLSKSSVYYIPEDTDIGGYRDYINVVLPSTDDSEAFGQHPNADISSQVRHRCLEAMPCMQTCEQVEETNILLDTIVSLQPAIATGAGETTEDKVAKIASDLASTVPEGVFPTLSARLSYPYAMAIPVLIVLPSL